MRSLKEMVANGQQVKFIHFLSGDLWYTTECGFEFPVPVDEAGDALFLATDKAMLFMRYIRKHLEYLKKAKEDHDNAINNQNSTS